MVVTQWAPIQNVTGVNQVTQSIPVPAGAVRCYARMDLAQQGWTDATQSLSFIIQATRDGGVSFQDLGGSGPGGWVGGPIGSKSGFRDTEVNLPPGATAVRASYTIVNGPIRFGVSGEFRDANGVGL